MVTTKVAREILSFEGKPLNHVTFDRLVSEGLLRYAGRVPGGARLFLEDDVKKLAKLMPKIRPANRFGIVNYLRDRIQTKAGK